MTDERETNGSAEDRNGNRAQTPFWAWWALFALIAAFIAAGAAGLAVVQVRELSQSNLVTLQRIVRLQTAARTESAQRRDQSCSLFERKHLDDVRQLRRLYRYLVGLSVVDRNTTLTKEIVRGLPRLERQAHIDRAPQYCDKPGIGLPEPDPVIPKRPASLRG